MELGGLAWKLVEKPLSSIGGSLYDRYSRYRVRRDIRRGTAGKFGILLTKFSDDTPTDSLRTTVYETIRRELGDAVQLTNWPDVPTLGDGYEYDIERRADGKVQTLLKERNCDLMISGRVKGRTTDAIVVSLRFTVAEAPAATPESYRLTETFDLPADFVGRLGAAIAARVVMAAAPAIHMDSHYIVPLMRAAAERMELIVRRPNPAFAADARASLLFNYALILSALGRQTGSNEALGQSIATYRGVLKEWTRERVPLQWAMTQNNLGTALWTLGEGESGTARLEEAVAACRDALKERTRERVPLQWAATQINPGNALQSLGERESGTARLEEAVAAFRDALKEDTRERGPLNWANTQNNLGSALTRLGERESGTAGLEDAVAAYRDALKERTRERVPLQWAATQNNLGTALMRLGERESGTERLEEAVAAYRGTLEEWTHERVPLDWALAQNNLGIALLRLGQTENRTAHLEQSVAAFRDALKERTRERVPLNWATTQNNLGTALWSLGERESGTERLEEAVVAYRAALDVFEAGGADHYVELAKRNLARVEALLAQRR